MGAFWRQPSAAYRDFQIVFTILTLNFTLPALTYTFDPHSAMEQFLRVNELLGGAPYTFPEADGRVWRYLAAANVMTLGFMCFLLQFDLRRFFPVLVPLTFMKAYAATCWLVGWLADRGAMFFLGAAVLDYGTSLAFVYFARRAHRDLMAGAAVVPRPQGDRAGRP